ncbi:ribonuclease HII, partial [Streptococcus mitis]|nr:ribonuclease HII [Streptococcus mitis]
MSIKEIKEILQGEVDSETLALLQKDERKGVQKLLESYNKRLAKLAKAKAAFMNRFQYEQKAW